MLRRSCRRYKHIIRDCEECKLAFHPYLGRKQQRFCGKQCYDKNKSKRFVEKTCQVCNKLYTVPLGKANSRVCSFACRIANTPKPNCLTCGKPFRGERGRNRSHCSEKCRRPAAIRECKNCGKPFRYVPNSDKVFCTFACYRRYKGETRLEERVRHALERIGIEFEAQASVGRYAIDFAIPSLRIALEADGVYWHNATKDDRRDRALRKFGWRTVRLSEEEINGSDDLDGLITDRIGLVPFAKAA